MTHSSRIDIAIGMLGLTQVERLTVRSVCSLTHSRGRGYRLLDAENSSDAQIMLVDADDASSLELWRTSPMCHIGRPALLISRDAEVVNAAPYALSRAGFAARLVRLLDQIAACELDGVTSVVGGDEVSTAGSAEFLATGSQSALPRALIIDASQAVQFKMSALLNLKGLGADVVDTAADGMRMMHAGRYAIVFIEADLPDMDGFTACRRIKAADRAFTPIVMLTQRSSAIDRMRGLMAGCNRYLVKPIAVQTLNKVLDEVIPEQMQVAATASGAFPALPVGEP
jgi:two-component system cell cycle response regulator